MINNDPRLTPRTLSTGNHPVAAVAATFDVGRVFNAPEELRFAPGPAAALAVAVALPRAKISWLSFVLQEKENANAPKTCP